MELDEYRLMYALEATHWWYRGLHEAVFEAMERRCHERRDLAVLDAGCGTGFVMHCLERYGRSFGVDTSTVALHYCRTRGLLRLAQASVGALPFRDATFDVGILTDVLYHRGVDDDTRALEELHRVLKPGGILILNEPAYACLRRAHDERIHTRHRYTRQELRSKLERSQFQILQATYRHAFLFPVAFCVTLVRRRGDRAASDLRPVSAPLNALLRGIVALENRLLRYSNLPFGTSVFFLCKR